MHEVDEGFVEMLPLEVILQLLILLKDALEQSEALTSEIEGVYEDLAAIIHVEVVDHVLILECARQLLALFWRQLMEAALLPFLV